MKNYNETKVDIIERAKKAVNATGMFKFSTCDHPNWNTMEHNVMISLPHEIDGLKITGSVKFGVNDWVITKV